LAIVFENKGGTWWAHDPDVEGVYGEGSSREGALADLAEATALLVDYEAGKAGEVAEGAEDTRLADAAYAAALAGAPVYTSAQVKAMFGLDEGRVKPLESTVRVGIVSDIHGDAPAFDQALARLRAMGVGLILCTGDLLDVEPFGEEVIQRLKTEGVKTICGKHERWALERRRRRPDPRQMSQGCNLGEPADLFGGGAELSGDSLAWLRTLPAHMEIDLAGVRVAMWHARPGSDMRGIEADKTGPALRRQLLERASADVLIVGHTHDAFELVEGEGKIINPGACCSKIDDGHRSATFGVLDLPSKRFRVFRATDGADQEQGL
jgi:predicted phosphodiesterase/predicted RNase H-like HicB family nuclease